MNYKDLIRDVPDFPKDGIVYKDITTLLKDGPAFSKVVDDFHSYYAGRGIDLVAGIESRGFIFGAALAYRLDIGLVPVRKKGKLPAESISESYQLEYGSAEIEVHRDAISNGHQVLLIDDLLATGGTMAAACKLVQNLGGQVAGIGLLIELDFLNGREKLDGYDIYSLVHY